MSTNGLNRSSRYSGTAQCLNDATWVGDTGFIVGAAGTVLASTDLVKWTNIGTLTQKALFGLATDSRQLVAVGVEGLVPRAAVLPDPTPICILRYTLFYL